MSNTLASLIHSTSNHLVSKISLPSTAIPKVSIPKIVEIKPIEVVEEVVVMESSEFASCLCTQVIFNPKFPKCKKYPICMKNTKSNEVVLPQRPQPTQIKEFHFQSPSPDDISRTARQPEGKKIRKKRAIKDHLSFVVVGHVDCGKSTLLGHFLHKMDAVNDKQVRKAEKQSQEQGKKSFGYAFLMDSNEEEQKRGVTVNLGIESFIIGLKKYTVLDAPGHRDFVPNMILGASKADAAVLCVDARLGEFEKGLNLGQTSEHLLLLKAFEVNNLICAINKMDAIDWDEQRYKQITQELRIYLEKIGYQSCLFVPVSGLFGTNLIKTELNWYQGASLLELLNSINLPSKNLDKPLKMQVTEQQKFSLYGHVLSGTVSEKQNVLLLPMQEKLQVQQILIDDLRQDYAMEGDHCTLIFTQEIQKCQIVSTDLVPCCLEFKARIVCFDAMLTPGFPCEFHLGSSSSSAIISKFISKLDKLNGKQLKKPRFLTKNMKCLVEIKLEEPMCMERYSINQKLGRFILRSEGKTIAAGNVDSFK